MASSETPSIFCFQSNSMVPKKKKKKGGERDQGEQEGERRRRRASESARERAECVWVDVCVRPRGVGRRVWPQAALARASPAGPHTHIPHPPDPRPRATDWLPIWGRGGRRGEALLPRSSPLPSPGTEIKISEMIPWLLLRLSREQNSSPSAASLRRDKCDHPRWGIAASSLPAHPRTEEKLKRNLTWADTPRKEEDGGSGTSYFRMGRPVGFQTWFDTSVSKTDFGSRISMDSQFLVWLKEVAFSPLLFPLRRIQKPLGRAVSAEENFGLMG